MDDPVGARALSRERGTLEAQPDRRDAGASGSLDVGPKLVSDEHSPTRRSSELLEHVQEHRRVGLSRPEVCRPDGGGKAAEDAVALERPRVVVAGEDVVGDEPESVAAGQLDDHVSRVEVGWPIDLLHERAQQGPADLGRVLGEDVVGVEGLVRLDAPVAPQYPCGRLEYDPLGCLDAEPSKGVEELWPVGRTGVVRDLGDENPAHVEHDRLDSLRDHSRKTPRYSAVAPSSVRLRRRATRREIQIPLS